MKTLNRFIVERLKLNKDTKVHQYHFFPTSFDELRELLKQLLKERGKDADLNDIDTSQVTTFYDQGNDKGLFEDLDPYNIDISKWDVSNVENMCGTFFYCGNFNCDLSKWNISNVKDTSSMFCNCKKFDSDLSNWNVRKIIEAIRMFDGCENFTGQGLEKWDVSNIKDMSCMFDGCYSLKNKLSWYK